MNQIKLLLGDSIEMLKKIEPISIDLCYADPPFFTQRNFTHDKSNNHAYTDRWDSIDDYLLFMRDIIFFIHKTLTPFGSFFLHCDYHASHHLKLLCDKIFGKENFRNEIIWRRASAHSSGNGIENVLDTIFYYTKSNKYTYNQIYTVKDKTVKRYNILEKETGRKFTTEAIENGANFKYKGESRCFYTPDGTSLIVESDLGWKWTQETIDERWKKNPFYFYITKNNRVRYKVYLDNYKGNKIDNDWTELGILGSQSKERTGYPTQKPEKLLERIIKLATNEGMCVLDPFIGSGTTMAVAKRLGRYGIGIDSNKNAIDITNKRLSKVKCEVK